MSCKVQDKAVNRLKQDGVLSNTLEILNLKEFDRLNTLYTDKAVNTYGLVAETELFSIKKNEIKLPFRSTYRRDNIQIVYRAVPNSALFEQLDKLVTPENIIENNNLFEEFNINFPTIQEIIDSENPLETKSLIDSLKIREKELNNLIKCING